MEKAEAELVFHWDREPNDNSFIMRLKADEPSKQWQKRILATIDTEMPHRFRVRVHESFDENTTSDWFYLNAFEGAKEFAEHVVRQRAQRFHDEYYALSSLNKEQP